MASTRYLKRLRVHHTGPGLHRGIVSADGLVLPCALGRAGIVQRKREGDGGTPAGEFPLRKLYFRADRGPRPTCKLDIEPITPQTGWCDDPRSTAYNRPIRVPAGAGHETMWREDYLYDLVIVIGHNDDPALRPFGSAIFMHLPRDGFGPTAGCVAIRRGDLLRLLPRIGRETTIAIG